MEMIQKAEIANWTSQEKNEENNNAQKEDQEGPKNPNCGAGNITGESVSLFTIIFNPLNAELNPICHLLALLRAHHILHVGRIRVNDIKL